MSFRNNFNKHEAWIHYCQSNKDLLIRLGLPLWVFKSEANFRDFATEGKVQIEVDTYYDFDELKNKNPAIFWQLFKFIDKYFGMDMRYFDKFEEARIEE